ncbi:DUF2231 domain-containing protein [Nocardioides sp.]|uniref:DUF2231 domain-containing protein n=1 Tax=Nocardioides sp. TaxID=35761 RepID=UPI0037CC6D34
MLDLSNGIPLHPLVVHAIVVLLPLANSRDHRDRSPHTRRRPYGPLVVTAALIATALAPVATSSREELEKRVGDPGEHAELGDTLVWFTLARGSHPQPSCNSNPSSLGGRSVLHRRLNRCPGRPAALRSSATPHLQAASARHRRCRTHRVQGAERGNGGGRDLERFPRLTEGGLLTSMSRWWSRAEVMVSPR